MIANKELYIKKYVYFFIQKYVEGLMSDRKMI